MYAYMPIYAYISVAYIALHLYEELCEGTVMFALINIRCLEVAPFVRFVRGTELGTFDLVS